MIGDVIAKCKDELWDDNSQEVVVSQLVYHVLFSADYNLSKTNDERELFSQGHGKYGYSDF